ncbi:MAG: hypothetical protein AB1641_07555 [Thermodesulfobacteriota bacterium]
MILFDVSSGREIRALWKPYYGGGVDHIAFSPDGKKAVTGGTDGIILWDLETGKMIKLFEGSLPSKSNVSGPCVDFSPDGGYILSGDFEDNIVLWKTETYEKIRTFNPGAGRPDKLKGTVHSLKFSPDGRMALSAGDRLILWDAVTGGIVRIFSGHKTTVVGSIITADGQKVLSGSWDNSLKVWSPESGELLRSIKLKRFTEMVSFSPDGKYAATGRKHSSVSIDISGIKDGALSKTLQLSKGKDGLSFTISPDGGKIAVGLCGRIELWDVEYGKRILTLKRRPTLPLIIDDIVWRYVRM